MMTKGQMKKFLASAQYLSRGIDRLQEQIIKLASLREKVTTSYSAVPGGGGDVSKIESLTCEIMELEDDQRQRIYKYLERYRAVQEAIDGLDDVRYSNILRMRYLEGERWEDIAYLQHYSWKQVFRLHNEALIALLEIANRVNDDTK